MGATDSVFQVKRVESPHAPLLNMQVTLTEFDATNLCSHSILAKKHGVDAFSPCFLGAKWPQSHAKKSIRAPHAPTTHSRYPPFLVPTCVVRMRTAVFITLLALAVASSQALVLSPSKRSVVTKSNATAVALAQTGVPVFVMVRAMCPSSPPLLHRSRRVPWSLCHPLCVAGWRGRV